MSDHTHVRPWRHIERRKSRQIRVGSVLVGGDAPISVQSMTNTPTTDAAATIDQIRQLEEAGADACRFMFLMKTAQAQIDFDLGLVEKQTKENPVFYFQMGHARCASILRKAKDSGVEFVGFDKVTDEHLAALVLPEEKAILKKMSALPEVVAQAATALEPHRVLYYCQELISEFHSYFTKYKNTERVVSSDVTKTQGRLALVASLKKTLKSAFLILGVDAPEAMAHLGADVGDDEEEGA
jgi:arginyl-tRNA synthetase